MPSIDTGFFALNVSGAALVGAATGYASKRILQLITLLVGTQLIFLASLEYTGVITVDWQRVAGAVEFGASWLQSMGVRVLISTGLMGGGFAAGFAYGFYRA
ncbi:MAG: FUN14 domain-containing protein [Candidatus Nanohaloarchaea archaeon]|nr:FUN14 domain-containing protein [Candidatus Nanohaloarchaea archaeon]